MAAVYTTWGTATDTGRVRTLNEDALLALPPVFLVADGMGGHEAGDVASRVVVEECSVLVGRTSVTIEDVQDCLERAVARMHDILGDRSGGATVAGAAVATHEGAPYWLVFNIGDSRVYRLSTDGFAQVSVDHSVVQELLDSGRLSEDEAVTHADRHVVTRALATDSSFEPDYWLIPVAPEDRLLVCSDGLTDELDDAALHRILSTEADPQAAAESLVEAALEAGGRDNVSVVVVDVATVWNHLGSTDLTNDHETTVSRDEHAAVVWDEQKHGATLPRTGGPRTATGGLR